MPDAGGWRLELICYALCLRDMRIVIPQVYIAAVRDAVYQVHSLVHAASLTEEVRRRQTLMRSSEGVPLHPLGRLNTCQTQHGGGQIDEADQAVRRAPRFVFPRCQLLPFLGKINDQRHLQTGIARPAFAAWHPAAMVGVIEDDGVVRQTSVRELAEMSARIGIRLTHFVVILGPVLTHFRRVGVIGGNANVRGLRNPCVGTGANLAFVTPGGVKDGKEGLVLRAVLPVRRVR